MNEAIIGGVDGPIAVTITIKLNPIFVIIIVAIVLAIAIAGFFVWRQTRAKR